MDEAQRKLIEFLESLKFLCEEAVPRASQLIYSTSMANHLKANWPSCKTNIDTTLSEIEGGEHELVDALTSAGLSGDQLQMKLDGFMNAKEEAADWQQPSVLKKIYMRIFGNYEDPATRLRSAFSWALIIIGSLNAVLDLNRYMEIVKEFLEAYNQALGEH